MFSLFQTGKIKLGWLDMADQAYTKALIYRKPNYFDEYGTDSCCTELADRISAGEALFAGTENYKKVSWEFLGKDSIAQTKTYIKSVDYDKIKYAREVYLSVDNSYQEIWVVDCSCKPALVSSIRRVVS